MTTARPLIGITTYGRDADNKYALYAGYVEAVRRAGGMAALLPHGETRVDELVARLDGLMLSGGGDIEPARYGGDAHEENYMVDAERDETELALVRSAVSIRMPIFGICRGAQVVNVALGGTLIEHLPDELGEAVAPRAPPRRPIPHEIRVRAGTRLAEIVGQEKIEVASWHHQGIRRAAEGLSVSAFAPDGAIEAVEMPSADHPWLIGVQWHPELTAAEDPIQQRLFDSFVAASAGRRGHSS